MSALQTSITFSGDKVQVYSNANPRAETWGLVTIDKTGGKLVLHSTFSVTNDVSCNGGYEQLTWKQGTIDLNGHDLCLGSYPTIKAGAKAIIPYGSHLRIKGYYKEPTRAITVEAGATLALEMPAKASEGDEPPVLLRTSLAQQNPFKVEILPKARRLSPRPWKFFTYGGSFTGFGSAKWSVTGPENCAKPSVRHEAEEKALYLDWKYAGPLRLILR